MPGKVAQKLTRFIYVNGFQGRSEKHKGLAEHEKNDRIPTIHSKRKAFAMDGSMQIPAL